MLIDSHIHAFADNIAARAVEKLETIANIKACTDGTVTGALKKLDEAGVDYGVVLPVATKPSQQTTINNWAKEIYKGKLISFGTVHPYADDLIDEIDRVKSLGLNGIKLHHDYQGVFIFDEKCSMIYKRCEELGLPVVMHMGYDPVSPLVHRAMPYDLIEMAEKYPKLKIIGAHMGGMHAWEAVYKYIAGNRNIYLDTAYVSKHLDHKLFTEIVKKHGTDRVLYGSDMPWSDPVNEIRFVEELDISDPDKDRIFYKNITELLELQF